jgi:hypothetical protein
MLNGYGYITQKCVLLVTTGKMGRREIHIQYTGQKDYCGNA